jgi:hypothetical protein
MATTATLSSSQVESVQVNVPRAREVRGQSFYDALTKWVPSEVIAVWLLVQAALGPLELPESAPTGATLSTGIDFTTRWYATAALVAGAMVIVALMYVGRSRDVGKDWKRRERGWAFTILLAAPASAAAWVLGLPDSPLYDFGWYSQAWGVVIVAATSTAIAALAYALDIVNPDYPVLVKRDG